MIIVYNRGKEDHTMHPNNYPIYRGGSVLGNPYTDKPLKGTLAVFKAKNREEAIEKYDTYFDTQFNIILMTIMGAVFSIVGQIGDLAASSVKRYCGQKDFSNLLPGHGGILDRFDSIMFISPILYIFMYLINLL